MSQNIRLRVNEQIRISPVRLIDHEKNMIGVVPTDEAMRMAREAGLDLVEMSPNERPPVCKIMDYGKHKYQISKKSKQKHHEQKIKEVRLRPKTEEHDLGVKMKHAREFLEHGDRVLITMLFRGRERFHQDIAYEMFRDIVKEMADISKVDQPPRLLGKKMSLVLAPLKLPPPPKQHQPNRPKPKPDHIQREGGQRDGGQREGGGVRESGPPAGAAQAPAAQTNPAKAASAKGDGSPAPQS